MSHWGLTTYQIMNATLVLARSQSNKVWNYRSTSSSEAINIHKTLSRITGPTQSYYFSLENTKIGYSDSTNFLTPRCRKCQADRIPSNPFVMRLIGSSLSMYIFMDGLDHHPNDEQDFVIDFHLAKQASVVHLW
jgi:hypothetical protein